MTTRRLFLLGAASLIASTALTEPLWNPPHLYGDGKHDDTEALAALYHRIAARGGGELYLPAGTYEITRWPWQRRIGYDAVTIHGASS